MISRSMHRSQAWLASSRQARSPPQSVPFKGTVVEFQPSAGGGVCNEIDHSLVAEQWLASPILSNVTEHAMLDLIPFARPRRQMAHLDREANLLGQVRKLEFPE